MKAILTDVDLSPLISQLSSANQRFQQDYPGLGDVRQPVHTLYGGANLYKQGAPQKMADLAMRHLQRYAPNFCAFARGLELDGASQLPVNEDEVATLTRELTISESRSDGWLACEVYRRVRHKLETEAVEDHRIDFEDGYGVRSDEEEDGHAEESALAMASMHLSGQLPPFVGIRIKALTEEAKIRSLRTLDIFLSTLAEATAGDLPSPFRVTLPKVTSPAQVAVLAEALDIIEQKLGLSEGGIDIELMIEAIQSVLTPSGHCLIPDLAAAGRGRVTAAVLGTFDYTATCNIASTYQDHQHPAVDFARHMMQAALTGTSVQLCDGITNIMPTPIHRGEELNATQIAENEDAVTAAWRAHFSNILHSLRLGFYQSWDLNPAQLPIRYAAVYYFFLSGLEDAVDRLRTFIDQAAQASMVGNTFDDAASAQGLLNFFISGISCGALKEEEALQTGITLQELHGRSFLDIVANRLERT